METHLASEDFVYYYPVSFCEGWKEHWRMIFCSPQADNMTLVFCYCGTQIFGNNMLFVQWQTPIFCPVHLKQQSFGPYSYVKSGSL